MKPNFVFFFTDDQRYDMVGALGNPAVQTPNIDWLVANGTAFTHACIPGGTVGAVCMPSRAMLHTGRSLFHLEKSGTSIPKNHSLLGETLRSEGYHTFGSGKWHNGSDAFHRSFADGDEIFFGGMADHWNVPAFHYDPSGKYEKHCLYIENPQTDNHTQERWCDHINAGEHSTDMIARAGISFLRSHPTDQPYFLYLAFLAPHDPRSMPREFLELYDPDRIELPPNCLPEHPFDNGNLLVRDENLAPFPRTPEEIRRHLAEYYAMITHLDKRVGEVIEEVRVRGELDNTVFVFAGDNGLAVGQHGLMGKQCLFEHSIRVPLIFSGPGIPKGERKDDLVYLLDIFPTVCDLAGISAPESCDGLCLAPAFAGSEAVGREVLYLAYRGFQRGVRTSQHKLIEYVVDGKLVMTQLFDLHTDPWEMHNLAGEADCLSLLSSLREELFRLRDEWDDQSTSWGETFWKGYQNS